MKYQTDTYIADYVGEVLCLSDINDHCKKYPFEIGQSYVFTFDGHVRTVSVIGIVKNVTLFESVYYVAMFESFKTKSHQS